MLIKIDFKYIFAYNKLMRFYLILITFILSFQFSVTSVNARDKVSTEKFAPEKVALDKLDSKNSDLDADENSSQQSFEQIKNDRLLRIRKEIVEVQSQIYLARKSLKNEKDSISKLKLESDLEKLNEKHKNLRLIFIETISNINLEKQPEKALRTELSEDIKQILDPIISGFKKISERPREIQTLKENITYIKSRIQDTKKAIDLMQEYKSSNDNKTLDITIDKSISEAKKIKKDFKIQLEDAQFKLIKLEKNEESIVSTFGGVIFDFIQTKGKNLLLALLVFGIFFWGASLGRDRIITLLMIRISKEVEYPGQIHWVVRPIKVIYGLLSFFIAFFFAVSTLYVLNDWVLVTLILFVMVAIIWSSKHYIPQYFEQFKIILNLGSIREGERIVYNGLPWKIKSLGYHCRLVNPALSGGFIRLSTKELLSSYSRPVGDTEPWFPSRNNDWVELNDGTYGKILMQSPETVQLKMIGDENRYINTGDYLSLNPVNLSQGFAIEFLFGVDYSHQKILFDELIPNFKKKVHDKLEADFSQNKAYIKEVSIEFNAAGASSLDLRFFLKCEGPLASQKRMIQRKIQSYFVEVCNEHDYIIPFNQLTVHMQKNS